MNGGIDMGRPLVRFSTIRPLLSKIDRISIREDDGSYENYRFPRDVPAVYDDYYVRGFGIIDGEFMSENPNDFVRTYPCVEFWLGVTPNPDCVWWD